MSAIVELVRKSRQTGNAQAVSGMPIILFDLRSEAGANSWTLISLRTDPGPASLKRKEKPLGSAAMDQLPCPLRLS